MDPQTLMEYENMAVKLAQVAGNMMKSASGNNKQIETKHSYADLVTETDKAIEVFVFEQLKKAYPSHKFIGEESFSGKVEWTDHPTWIIDPIDGTMNFVHTFPFTCISIGLAVSKELVLGVVYSPFLDKLYTAKKGFGAYCNGVPLSVSKRQSLHESVVILEFGYSREQEHVQAIKSTIDAIAFKCSGVRSLGSAALNLCMIASGSAEAYFETGFHIWDLAAGIVIVREAGGVVIDTQGGKVDIFSRRALAACNEKVAKEVSGLIPVHLSLERDD